MKRLWMCVVLILPIFTRTAPAGEARTDPVQKAIDIKNSVELGKARFAIAAARLTAILRKDPKNGNAHRVLAWIHIAQNKREAARAEFIEAQKNLPEQDINRGEVDDALQKLGGAPGEPGKAGAPGPEGAAAPDPSAMGGAPPDALGGGMPGGTPGTMPGGMPDPSTGMPGGAPPGTPPDAGATPPGSEGASPGGPPAGTPDATGATPPADTGGGGGLPIPLIAGAAGALILIGVLVKKFVLDKGKAGGA